jgi:hypothetical protein
MGNLAGFHLRTAVDWSPENATRPKGYGSNRRLGSGDGGRTFRTLLLRGARFVDGIYIPADVERPTIPERRCQWPHSSQFRKGDSTQP